MRMYRIDLPKVQPLLPEVSAEWKVAYLGKPRVCFFCRQAESVIRPSGQESIEPDAWEKGLLQADFKLAILHSVQIGVGSPADEATQSVSDHADVRDKAGACCSGWRGRSTLAGLSALRLF